MKLSKLYIAVLLIIIWSNFLNAETISNNQYKVSINDILGIMIIDHEELGGQFIVTSDGTITLPFIGAVYVKDKNISEIKEDITKKLSEGYIKYPIVSVTLLKSGKKIITFGEVRNRGEIPFQEDMTVMTGLSSAGGASENGLYGKIKVRRKKAGGIGYKDIIESELDFGKIVNKEVENTLLKPDDILIVENNNSLLIQGEVSQRGRIILEKNMTVLSALLRAGGATSEGLYGKLNIRRKQAGASGGYKDIAESELDFGVIVNKEVEDTLLKPDDILIVEKNKTFLIQGEVANRGRFPLEKGMTVLRALLQAGGITSDGLHGKIKLRRKQEGVHQGYRDFVESKLDFGMLVNKEVEDTWLEPDDILIVEKNKTFLIQGEVANRGRFIIEKNITVLRALLQAGGVTPDGLYGNIKIRRKQDEKEKAGYVDIAEAKLNKGIIENKEFENTFLEPDDVLSVERNKTYFIYGEANKTGEFVLQSDSTVFNAITIAGGFTKWGSPRKVEVLRLTDDDKKFIKLNVNVNKIIEGDASVDLLLKAGDTIVVSPGTF